MEIGFLIWEIIMIISLIGTVIWELKNKTTRPEVRGQKGGLHETTKKKDRTL